MDNRSGTFGQFSSFSLLDDQHGLGSASTSTRARRPLFSVSGTDTTDIPCPGHNRPLLSSFFIPGYQTEATATHTDQQIPQTRTRSHSDSDWFQDSFLDRNQPQPTPSQRLRTPRLESIQQILSSLANIKMSPMDLLLEVLDPKNTKFLRYRSGLYS